MTCKDCVHQELCYANCDKQFDDGDNTCFYCKSVSCPEKPECKYFKDKSRFVELPCKFGDTVYTLNNLNTIDSGRVVDMRIEDFGLTITVLFGNKIFHHMPAYEFCRDWFTSYEEAERALKERTSK